MVSENPGKAAAAGLIIQFIRLSTGGVPKGYVDPDQAGGTIVVRPEQIDMKLNGRKRPANPNDGVGVDEPLDPNTIPPGAGTINPTQTLTDPDAMTFIASGDVPLKVSTSPIHPVHGPDGASPPTGARGNPWAETTNTSGD